jgi:hypothetical protein
MLMNDSYVNNISPFQFQSLMQDESVINELAILVALYQKIDQEHFKYALKNCNKLQFRNFINKKYSSQVFISKVLYSKQRNAEDMVDFL